MKYILIILHHVNINIKRVKSWVAQGEHNIFAKTHNNLIEKYKFIVDQWIILDTLAVIAIIIDYNIKNKNLTL